MSKILGTAAAAVLWVGNLATLGGSGGTPPQENLEK